MIIKVNIKGIDFEFETSIKCFSPGKIDAGTLAMLSCVEFQKGQKILDLGCGYGVVGKDKFWNTEQLVRILGEVDGVTVSAALYELSENINFS